MRFIIDDSVPSDVPFPVEAIAHGHPSSSDSDMHIKKHYHYVVTIDTLEQLVSLLQINTMIKLTQDPDESMPTIELKGELDD